MKSIKKYIGLVAAQLCITAALCSSMSSASASSVSAGKQASKSTSIISVSDKSHALAHRNYSTFSILGDSYSTFSGYVSPLTNPIHYPALDVTSVEKTWWYEFGRIYSSKLVTNNSYSGSTIASKTKAFYERLDNLDITDLVLIFGGTNDVWKGVPLGDYVYSSWKSYQLAYFRPALAYTLYCITSKNPCAEVVFMKNELITGEYSNSIDIICQRYGVKVLNLNGIGVDNIFNRHPGYDGMMSIAGQLVNYLDTYGKLVNHIPGSAVKENVVEATDTQEGSYDTVVRCTNCDKILSSKTVKTPKDNSLEVVSGETLCLKGKWAGEPKGSLVYYVRKASKPLKSQEASSLQTSAQFVAGFTSSGLKLNTVFSVGKAKVTGSETINGKEYSVVEVPVKLTRSAAVRVTLTCPGMQGSAYCDVLAPGDVNHDGRVNNSDAILIDAERNRHIYSRDALHGYLFELSDLNQNGKIDAMDVTLVSKAK